MSNEIFLSRIGNLEAIKDGIDLTTESLKISIQQGGIINIKLKN